MTTETLEGRSLDIAVARVLGHANVRHLGSWGPVRDPTAEELEFVGGRGLPFVVLPRYSAADYSGFAPVEAWLVANRPPDGSALLLCCKSDGWIAGWFGLEVVTAPTLPAAACRLLVAWAERKAAL